MFDVVGMREQVGAEAARLAALPTGSLTQEDWAEQVSGFAALANACGAALAVAMARTASFKVRRLEDGTSERVERPGGLGDEDGASIVAGRLGCTEQAAATRVATATTVVADLPRTFAAMAAGTVDDYRASRIATEVAGASREVRRAVDAAIQEWLGAADADGVVMAAPGPRLADRARTALARIDRTQVRDRAARARAARGVFRGFGEPGTEEWRLILPAEQAGPLWATIDAPAQRMLREGTADTIAQARLDALLEIVGGRITGRFDVVLAVPAGTSGPDVRACVLDRLESTAQVEVGGLATSPTSVPATWVAELVRSGSSATRFGAVASHGLGRASVRVRVATCDPVTGALAEPLTGPHVHAVASYRPNPAMVRLVKARDRRCRFPGCQVSVRYCDLDHVRPWPLGPTDPANLLCLCRRHHRTKQREGWSVRLDEHGIAWWTDPTGHESSTVAPDLAGASLRDLPVCDDGLPAYAPSCPDPDRERIRAAESSAASNDTARLHGVLGFGLDVPDCFDDALPRRRRRRDRRRSERAWIEMEGAEPAYLADLLALVRIGAVRRTPSPAHPYGSEPPF